MATLVILLDNLQSLQKISLVRSLYFKLKTITEKKNSNDLEHII